MFLPVEEAPIMSDDIDDVVILHLYVGGLNIIEH